MGTFISAYYIHFLQYLARFCQELVLPLHITTEPVELPCYATLFLQMLYSNRPQSVPASIDLEQFQVPRTKLVSSFAYFFTVARKAFISVPLYLSSMGYPGHGNLCWSSLNQFVCHGVTEKCGICIFQYSIISYFISKTYLRF